MGISFSLYHIFSARVAHLSTAEYFLDTTHIPLFVINGYCFILFSFHYEPRVVLGTSVVIFYLEESCGIWLWMGKILDKGIDLG